MRIALIGSRLGYIYRGFESFTRTLFDLVKDDLDITLFKGAGESSEREIVVPSFWFEGGILSKLRLPRERRMLYQERSFALALLSHLLREQFDVIHFSEVALGKVLYRFKKLMNLDYVLLFSNGAPAPPRFYHQFDVIQELTGVHYQEALDYGIPESKLVLVPYGVDCGRFNPVSSRVKEKLRREFNLPNKLIVLCVAAIKKEHKRIDWLVREFSQLDQQKYFLLVTGHQNESSKEIQCLAEKLLGDNFRFLTVRHKQIHKIYRLSDFFLLPSLTEGFGIVFLEAMATNLPVLAHNAPVFQWVLNNDYCTIDMAVSGNIARKIVELSNNQHLRKAIIEQNYQNVTSRFDWQKLKTDYIQMYQYATQNGD
jgi:1,2-diacylglycerol 3-alpha-glucosyltransferase